MSEAISINNIAYYPKGQSVICFEKMHVYVIKYRIVTNVACFSVPCFKCNFYIIKAKWKTVKNFKAA